MHVCMYVSFGQGSSLLWTHTLRPLNPVYTIQPVVKPVVKFDNRLHRVNGALYSRPTALTQEGRSQVDDVCECVRD